MRWRTLGGALVSLTVALAPWSVQAAPVAAAPRPAVIAEAQSFLQTLGLTVLGTPQCIFWRDGLANDKLFLCNAVTTPPAVGPDNANRGKLLVFHCWTGGPCWVPLPASTD